MGIYFIVCPLVFLAGFVDSIAGGGANTHDVTSCQSK